MSGPLLIFVDSDDFVTTDFVEKLVAAQRSTGADIVSSRLACKDLGGRPISLEPEISKLRGRSVQIVEQLLQDLGQLHYGRRLGKAH